MEKGKLLFAKSFFHDYRTLLGLWFILAVVAAVMKLDPSRCNNFLIFRGVFWHTWNETSLYIAYPAEYFDVNHYGPLFSLLIAPFAVVPHWLGLLLWEVALALFLYVAVRKSQFDKRQQLFVLWFCAHELLTALYMQQFNIGIAAIILLSYYYVEKEQDGKAAFFIALGTLVKLYGIVGLAFFFFSKHKGRFLGMLTIWLVVLFAAPMLISSPEYVVNQYHEWFNCLIGKNEENMASIAQNISLLGLVQRTTGMQFSDLFLMIPGLVLFAIPYLRFKQYQYQGFRQTLLASVLLFVVLFSTGSESSSYIIALVGVVVWYTACPWRRGKWELSLLVLAFILTSLSPSDLFPAWLRKEWVQPYALKALPCVIIWLQLCYEMIRKDYRVS